MRTRLRQEDGAAAVEFALIVGVLAMLIFGMLQFGLAFFSLQDLRAATREGARVGALQGTGFEAKTRVAAASGVSNLGGSLTVYRRTAPNSAPCPSSTCVAIADDEQPCVVTTGTKPESTVAKIDLSSPSLPASLQNIFTIDIPLMPQIDLRKASVLVQGEFRCEG